MQLVDVPLSTCATLLNVQGAAVGATDNDGVDACAWIGLKEIEKTPELARYFPEVLDCMFPDVVHQQQSSRQRIARRTTGRRRLFFKR